ncbi:MAG: DNA primase [Candidatus Zambryskibacteria bacterium CG10_big_fil_rev_8_21_14_0_10_34_34]|uniref:DNA primase n=1 Tax=Candidatus Zambryskibacteria bacterium CG10_big_fil_rev_8_21_14_0_10_34_34 TaxID=1975114 RepID=A0A2H0R1I5_9BACT|nr:MAG: DNA primase [Candidatus Zambryskibacteria bacterium CG10_big_fil_rev_8_21_14_0_10_34_34]
MLTNVEQIKEKLDIVDVISSYIKVEKAGINYKAKCPFHNEKTPSFFISPTRQSFYCFGCGEKGDIFSFVEKFEGLDFKGALETLASKAGVELKNFKQTNDTKGEKDKLFEIMEKATQIFEKQLTENKEALNILKKRGVMDVSIVKWRLGFAKNEWRSLYDNLQNNFSKEEMLEAGLIKKTDTETNSGQIKYYDTFRDRIMFPLNDSAGRVIAFSGRAIKEDDKTPKYLNSPETKLFYKSEALYGFNIAKNHIRKLDYTVLVEGQMDLLMSHQAGILNTVASSGTALTELHLKKIGKLSNRIIIAYDSDDSGEKASRRAAEMAMALGMEIKTVSLPKGEDPASIIKKDPAKWKKALKESQHFIDFSLNKALKEKEDRNLTKEIIKNVLPLVSLIKSEIEKSIFVKKIALKMKVREQDVLNDLKKIDQKENLNKEEGPFKNYSKVVNLERILAGIIFLEEFNKSKKSKNLKEKWQQIVDESKVTEILENFKENKEALIFETEGYGEKGSLDEIAEDILKRLELKNLKTKLQKITIILDDKNLSKKDQKETKTDFNKIQKRIKELNN